MSITVQVGLLSGKTATVTGGFHEDVETLMSRAQAALGVGRGRLLDSLASLLDAHAPIKDSRLQNGDFLFLQLSPVQACRTSAAFATILGDGSVLTWGDEASGGDSRAVQEKLKNVQQIQASYNLVTMLLLPFLAMDPS